MKKFASAFLLFGLALALSSVAAIADALYVAYMAKVPAVAPKVKTLDLVQDAFVERLMVPFGPVVGYKVGLTSKAVQEKFGVSEPIKGKLLEKMLLTSGASVPARFGARPIAEADLMVRVKDEGINEAKTPEEVLAHLDAVIPFIELPDLLVRKKDPLTGPVIAAINVGARLGVLGEPVPAENLTPEALAAMPVAVYVDDKEVMRVEGRAILGQPLNAVLWLIQSGERLKAGDLVSLGSLGKPLLPKPGSTLKVVYEGLGEVSVSFK